MPYNFIIMHGIWYALLECWYAYWARQRTHYLRVRVCHRSSAKHTIVIVNIRFVHGIIMSTPLILPCTFNHSVNAVAIHLPAMLFKQIFKEEKNMMKSMQIRFFQIYATLCVTFKVEWVRIGIERYYFSSEGTLILANRCSHFNLFILNKSQ